MNDQQIIPNDTLLELGQKETLRFRFARYATTNSIDGTPTVTSNNLTIGTVTVDGTDVLAPVTASQTGTHTVKCTATLENGDIIPRVIRVKVIDSTCSESRDRYN